VGIFCYLVGIFCYLVGIFCYLVETNATFLNLHEIKSKYY
jgi:uncharacterized membrane protein